MNIHDKRRHALRRLIAEVGSAAEFARRYDIDATYLSQLLNEHRNMGEKSARNIERRLGLAVGTLDDDGNRTVTSNIREPHSHYGRTAPIISWVQAGEWNEVSDIYAPGFADEWAPVPEKTGPTAFWLRVRGDSMTAAHGTSIPHDTLILVEPDLSAENGDLVVAKLLDTQEAVFKKLVMDAGRKYLMPLNPAYDKIEINGNCRLVGVVKQALLQL